MKMRSVQDEGGYNQGWSGGEATRIRGERRCEMLMTQMKPAPTRSVLEIGCGRGEIAHYLASRTGMQVLGVDRSDQFVREASIGAAGGNLRFESFDFMEAEQRFGGRRFDYIVGNGILHHLYHQLGEALSVIRRLLADNGRIAFLEPNLHNPYVYLIFTRPALRRRARLEPDEMAFSRRFALETLAAAGFGEPRVEYRDFLLPGVPDWTIGPLVAIGRVAERTPAVKHLAQSLFITARAASAT